MIGEFPQDRAAEPSWLTVPLSYVYGTGAWLHRRWRAKRALKVPAPVISIGGITAGGSGKTPLTIALCKRLMELEPRLAEQLALCVLSRGYGRSSRGLYEVQEDSRFEDSGDEPLLIKRALPQTGVIVCADRRESARFAIEKLRAKLLVLDDGFQHGLLARDLNIVILDGQRPLGNGFVLPAGPLREFESALSEATDLVSSEKTGSEFRELCERYKVRYTVVERQVVFSEALQGRKCGAICGIAHPERFFVGLEQAGATILHRRAFRDHHVFSSGELSEVVRSATQVGAQILVTTAKDTVRFSSASVGMPLVTADVELRLPAGGEFEDGLKLLLSRLVW